MRKSIGAATAALVVAGTVFMACGDTSEDEFRNHYSYAHPLMNCVQTEVFLRGRQGLEVTEEDRRKIERECSAKLRR